MLRRRPSRDGLIEVQDLIARLDDAELLEAANGYFAQLDLKSEQCHKPFSNVTDAIHITKHLSLLLEAADLFRHAMVLDFGCATGWLTLGLADLGMSATGVDVSANAIALAEAMLEERGVRAGGHARFVSYEGGRLPFDDQSFDRILCFDAFHHVRDQSFVLSEFSRVLRRGGRVAMLEPGPDHSITPQSQMEMARYKVIENDVVMSHICTTSGQLGFDPPQMLVQFQRPVAVPAAVFNTWESLGALPSEDAQMVLSHLENELTDTQCFFMTKGEAVVDSRQPGALAAEVQLLSVATSGGEQEAATLRLRVRNTGEAVWLRDVGVAGEVNLGVHLMRSDGTVDDMDHARFPLGDIPVPPGNEVELVVRVERLLQTDSYLRFDLVSEQVAWFEQSGRSNQVNWTPDS